MKRDPELEATIVENLLRSNSCSVNAGGAKSRRRSSKVGVYDALVQGAHKALAGSR